MTPPTKKFPFPGYYLLGMLRDPLRLFAEIAAVGDVVNYAAGDTPCCMVTHPERIKELLVDQARKLEKGPALQRAPRFLGQGLIVSDGPFHQRQRRLSQPAFARARIATYAREIVALAADHSERWQSGAEVDLYVDLQGLALRIVGATLFGVDMTREGRSFAASVNLFIDSFPIFMLPYFDRVAWLPLPRLRWIRAANREVRAFVADVVRRRRADDRRAGDLLDLLMAAQDGEGDGRGMTDEQLADECVSLLVAGFETVATGLTWTLHTLAEHPVVAARVVAELDQRLAGRLPTFEDIVHLEYTGQVLSESMRLHPPVWTVVRSALEPVELGPFVLPRGTCFVIPQWVVHRDPRWYAAPHRFDPDHFAPAAVKARPRYAYFPFGGGPHQCIGDHFAWTEAILVLATLLQRWRIHPTPGPPMRAKPSITLRPGGHRRVLLEQRRSSTRC